MKSSKADILVCCPSYKRPTQVDTLRYLQKISVYVSESEALNYRKSNPGADIRTMPDKVQGNIARVRNWILDQNKGRVVCIVDDDLQWIGWHEQDEAFKIEGEDQLYAFIKKYTLIAKELETPLWGINLNMDKQCYREYTPFSLTSVVLAPFMVHIDPVCRFDENIPLKEDYDFCLQTLNRHRRILRVNKYHYLTKQGGGKTGIGQTGGCASMRSLREERRQLALLQAKWGDKIIQLDGLENSRSHKSSKQRSFDINPIVRVPIKGV